MAKKQSLYQINGSTGYKDYIKSNPEGNRECPKMAGFLDDNKGSILTDDQARRAWLAACVTYGNSFSGNVEGTMGKGFDMNVPWVAKRCDSVNVFTQTAKLTQNK